MTDKEGPDGLPEADPESTGISNVFVPGQGDTAKSRLK